MFVFGKKLNFFALEIGVLKGDFYLHLQKYQSIS
jgi:hypothetical protein